jgi:hypothetical protein
MANWRGFGCCAWGCCRVGDFCYEAKICDNQWKSEVEGKEAVLMYDSAPPRAGELHWFASHWLKI